MSDKLEWMNKHFVLLRHKELDDVCKIEGYKIRPDVQSFFDNKTDAEEVVWNFANAERWKCACELMAYMAHRRAAVWWAYQCVQSLMEELKEVPAEDRDIDNIALSFEPIVPDFAKVEPPPPDPEKVSEAEAALAQMQADYQQMRAMVDPDALKFVEDAVEIAYKEYEKKYGIHPKKMIEIFTERLKEDPIQIDRNSPIFKAADEIKSKLMAVRKETLDTVHAVIPPKVPEHEAKVRDNALEAAYRWIVSPDEINAKKALDIGNECPDTPAGLLALCAFWAGGNLMPDSENDQVVPTPNGLAANGICQVLLMCALHKGGTRKLKERYEHYFGLGVEVMTGENNWEKDIVPEEEPHFESDEEGLDALDDDDYEDYQAIVSAAHFKSPAPAPSDAPNPEPTKEDSKPVKYQRWKPTNKR